ncbi:MAG: TIGR00159 family protein [Candidatus Competibacteraceae bacterium]|nr:TIGR00159 family protein [Candidatus Competibacteraceae bacterium]
MQSLLFIHIGWMDILDVLLVGILIYQLYQLVKGTAAINIFFGILSVYVVYLIVDAMGMKLLSQILGQFIGVGMIALIIVFQQEIRRFLLFIGTTGLQKRFRFLRKVFPNLFRRRAASSLHIEELRQIISELSDSRTGAILILLRKSELKLYVNTGVLLNARVSPQLISSIFYRNSPLHDGAVIIRNHTIIAARCVLPISEKADFPENLGLRHRAAVGVTEHSDALALIVSEQTGQMSLAYQGKMHLNLDVHQMMNLTQRFMQDD